MVKAGWGIARNMPAGRFSGQSVVDPVPSTEPEGLRAFGGGGAGHGDARCRFPDLGGRGWPGDGPLSPPQVKAEVAGPGPWAGPPPVMPESGRPLAPMRSRKPLTLGASARESLGPAVRDFMWERQFLARPELVGGYAPRYLMPPAASSAEAGAGPWGRPLGAAPGQAGTAFSIEAGTGLAIASGRHPRKLAKTVFAHRRDCRADSEQGLNQLSGGFVYPPRNGVFAGFPDIGRICVGPSPKCFLGASWVILVEGALAHNRSPWPFSEETNISRRRPRSKPSKHGLRIGAGSGSYRRGRTRSNMKETAAGLGEVAGRIW